MTVRISEDLISEICGANDIVDYVSQYVQLKKSGKDYSGLCPFHREKSPSFHVSQDRQLFHCFGCGASGNLVQFVMRTENLDFVEAMKLLADKAGIVIPENGGITNQDHEKKKRILEMNRAAARFFYSCLKDKSVGADAQLYFAQRHISWKTVTVFGMGYAPGTKTALLEHLRSKGYTDSQAVEAGLAIERGGKIMDKFRNRVMFPIIDVRGNVIGFGGRIMNDVKEINGYKIPKYLNSSETAAFDKGRNLFALNLAKNEKASELILCEGYMDVISTYQAGVKNIVATLGTAITENQAKLMLRYANEILICYDMDEAGQKAALRAIEIINSVDGKSRVMKLKGAKDPDEYINKNGIEAFRNAIRKAVPSTEFKLSLIKGKYDTSTTDGKIKFASEAAEALIGINDAIEVDAYIRRIAKENELNPDAVYSEYKKKTSKNTYKKIPTKQQYQNKQSVVSTNKDVASKKVNTALIEAEKRLLSLIAEKKKLYKLASKKLKPEDFSTEVYRKLAKIIYDCYENDRVIDEAMILNEFSGNNINENEATTVFFNHEKYDGDEETVKELIKKIMLEKIKAQIENESDLARLNELFAQKRELEKNTWED